MHSMNLENPDGLVIRHADVSDWPGLVGIDSIAASGDDVRRVSIRRWCEQGSVLLAEDASGLLGYSVLEYTFFEQGFITMVTVAPTARRRGVGARLLKATEAACTSPKLFTSTNVSNHPMQLLLQRVGWSPVGLLHGLDEGDPELFYLCPGAQRGGLVEAEG
ncbi:GNAT family N-acetyltransferase [Streptomyces sp. NRRL S-455]|uniref:GNAT family N-acetyltransferase n=1 Tax=Streptomyces sp. NRRL S-455 TaxID=1463908 RepID=UPI0004BF5406|nr:GNAT family N-acetyltransferase [Streptomyces sp. NRRL S-455]